MSTKKEDSRPSKIVILTEADVRSLLDMGEAIEAMESIFRAYEENKIQMIPRQYLIAEEYESPWILEKSGGNQKK